VSAKKLSKVRAGLYCVLILGLSTSRTASSEPLPNTGQIIKYFNPVHPKSYTNESQDRIIKKKSFKNVGLSGTTAVKNKEVGLFALVNKVQPADIKNLESVLKSDDVNGLSCLIAWKQLERTEEHYDFRVVDDLLDLCKKHHKSLILRVSTCGVSEGTVSSINQQNSNSDTPDWVFQSGVKSIEYPGADGKFCRMPIFWDTTYLAKWANFINELGRRYDSRSALHSVGITGGGTLGSTNIVPDFLGSKDNYQNLEKKLKDEFQMTPRQLVSHWKYVVAVVDEREPH
jgi:hypothetical protein